jgi:hypothetical protein
VEGRWSGVIIPIYQERARQLTIEPQPLRPDWHQGYLWPPAGWA